MKDQNVEVLLNTHLLSISSREDGKTRAGSEQIFRLIGKVLQENAGGIVLAVKSVGSEKGMEKDSSQSTLFIPYHKIDHVILQS